MAHAELTIDDHLMSAPSPPPPLPHPQQQQQQQHPSQQQQPQPTHWMAFQPQDAPMLDGYGSNPVSRMPPPQHMDASQLGRCVANVGRHVPHGNPSSSNNNIDCTGDMKVMEPTGDHAVQQAMKHEPMDPSYPNVGGLSTDAMQRHMDMLASPYAVPSSSMVCATGSQRSNSEGSLPMLSSVSTRRSSRSSHDGLLRCHFCPKKWSDQAALQQHMTECRLDRTHECGTCGKRFKARGGLQQHMRIHNNDRPYTCKFCPKRFTQKSHVDQHERIHTGAKPFACQFCGRAFRQRSQQMGHEGTHSHQIASQLNHMQALQQVTGDLRQQAAVAAAAALQTTDAQETGLLSHGSLDPHAHSLSTRLSPSLLNSSMLATSSTPSTSSASSSAAMLNHDLGLLRGNAAVSSLLGLQSHMQQPIVTTSSHFQAMGLIHGTQ